MLKSTLSSYFAPKTKEQGAALFKDRKLSGFFANTTGFSVRVDADRLIQVSFEENAARQWQPFCSCLSGSACQHIWAAVLYLDSEGSKKPVIKRWLKANKIEAKIVGSFAKDKKKSQAALPSRVEEGEEGRAEWKYFVKALAHGPGIDGPLKPPLPMQLALVVNAKRSRALDRLVFGVYTRKDASAKFKKSVISIGELDQFPGDRKLLDFFFDIEGFHGDPSYPRNVLDLSHLVFPRDRMNDQLVELAQTQRLYASLSDLHERRPMAFMDRSAAAYLYRASPDNEGLELDLLVSDGDWTASCRSKDIEILCASYALSARTLLFLPTLDERGKLWLRFIEDNLSITAQDQDAFLAQVSQILPLSDNSIDPEPSENGDLGTPLPTASFRQSDLEYGELCYGTLTFRYEGAERSSDDESRTWDTRPLSRPNLMLERQWLQGLKDLPGVQMPHRTQIAFASRDFEWVVSQLITWGWAITLDKRPLTVVEPQLTFKNTLNWLELSVEMDGLDVDLDNFIRTLKKTNSLIVLSDGTSRILEPKTRRTLERLTSLLQRKDQKLRLDPRQVPLLEQLVMSLPEQKLPDFVVDYRQTLREAQESPPIHPLPSFRGLLRPYQRDGVNWLSRMTDLSFGVCLADEMGLGKTIQILALLDLRRDEATTSLIVMPRSLIGNWQAELNRFVPRLKVLDFSSGKRTATDFAAWDIVLTTYGVLLRESEVLSQFPWQHVILDEAQAIKNYRSQTAEAAHTLQGRYRIALSGTPIENDASEVVSLFRFLNPGLLGTSTEKALLQKTIDPEDLGQVARSIRPLMLRRRKEDVTLDLPPKIVNTLYCDMDKAQQKIYAEYTKYYKAKIKEQVERSGFGKAKLLMIEAMLRLRQISCHPGLVRAEALASGSAKIDILMEKLEELQGSPDKVLVFSQFTKFLGMIEDRLREEKISYEYLDGKTRDRTERVARFQGDPEVKVFLISLKAGGVGLNLTAARYAFIMDPWWNPAVEEQAIARAHRIGQTQQVISYKIVVRHSIEEKILQLQEQKQDLVNSFMEGEEEKTMLRTLTPEDLDLLMS